MLVPLVWARLVVVVGGELLIRLLYRGVVLLVLRAIEEVFEYLMVGVALLLRPLVHPTLPPPTCAPFFRAS